MTSDQAGRGGGDDRRREDAELSERLRRLDAKLGPRRADDAAGGDGKPVEDTAGRDSLGKAMRLSTEFVAGIVAGGIVGWLVDRFAGVAPFGMIVFVLLGFGAGLMNVLRASGMVGGRRG